MDGVSTALIAFCIALALHGGTQQHGVAPHYAKGVMEKVAARRGLAAEACMVSSPIHPVGAHVWVWGERTQVLLRCLVADVSHPRDRARHLRTGRVIELGYASTAAICGNTTGPARACPVWVMRVNDG